MEMYAVVAVTVFLVNLLPAFAPPTWAVLVYFALGYELNPIAMMVLGVLSAGGGRFLLAHGTRSLRPWLPTKYVSNLENLGSQFVAHTERAWALLTLFFFSPLSSAQLFEAAGLMRHISISRITLAFMAGRTVTYSAYVLGAQKFSETDIGRAIRENITDPRAIALQILMVLGLIGLGFVSWKPAALQPQDSDK